MDTPALIAALTTTLTIGLTIVLLRILRQERQRSEARVTALVTLSAQPAGPSMRAPAAAMAFEEPPVRLEPKPRRAAPAAAQPLRRETALDRPRTSRLNAASIDIFRDADSLDAHAASAPGLFDAPAPRAANNLFYIGAGALTLAVLIALSFGWAFGTGEVPAEETTASIATAPSSAAAPLALLALRHEQGADGTLVISGVVRNPAEAAARQRLFAAASLIDAGGTLVASARAPLDFTILEPGEESPFVVRVTGANGVARYRIGFRDAEGASVAHLDKR
jgi:hypothetical protein